MYSKKYIIDIIKLNPISIQKVVGILLIGTGILFLKKPQVKEIVF